MKKIIIRGGRGPNATVTFPDLWHWCFFYYCPLLFLITEFIGSLLFSITCFVPFSLFFFSYFSLSWQFMMKYMFTFICSEKLSLEIISYFGLWSGSYFLPAHMDIFLSSFHLKSWRRNLKFDFLLQKYFFVHL